MVIALKLIDSWWSPADWCNNSQIDFIFWLTDIVVLWEKIAFAVARRSLNKKVCNFVGKCCFGWWFFNQGISRWTGGGKWKWHWNMNYKIYQGLIYNQVQISSIIAKVVCGTTVNCSIWTFKRQVWEDAQKIITLYEIGQGIEAEQLLTLVYFLKQRNPHLNLWWINIWKSVQNDYQFDWTMTWR